MSKSRDTLQSYFDDLLSDIAEGDKLLEASVISKPDHIIDSNDKHNSAIPDASTTADITQTHATKPISTSLEEISPKLHQADQLSSRLVTIEEEQFALAEEKKRQLQQLLMPETINIAVKTPVAEKQIPKPIAPVSGASSVDNSPIVISPSKKLDAKAANKDSRVDSDLVDDIDLNVTTSINRLDEFLEWGENGRPMWAQNKFDALLFQVSGLTLAVPLIALGQIVNMSDELTPLFGQSDWFMGILPTPIGKLRTINTALFVMPERYNPSFVKTAKYVISLDGQPWGLAVDSVTQPITLDPDEVKWRGVRSSRPWLAGTVKSSMCALIDIPQMAKLLNASDKSLSR